MRLTDRCVPGQSAAPAGPEALAGYVTRIVALPITAIHSLLVHLLWHDKQRSEYFADYLAATIAGTVATEALLSKSTLEEHLAAVLLRNAYSTTQSGDYILGLFGEGSNSCRAANGSGCGVRAR